MEYGPAMTVSTASNPIIVALDVPSAAQALDLARALKPHVGMVKLGLESFVGHGPALVRDIRACGVDVFLDLKLHDIPRTAAAAAAQVKDLDVRLLTVHASGGPQMVQGVRDALPGRTQIIAVTMLTSLDEATVSQLGYAGDLAGTAKHLGTLAMEAGANGLVCSAHELNVLKPLGGLRVVPGVRPAGSAAGDQKRVATPAAALAAGATWIVVGRPIVGAQDPVAAAQALCAELSS